MRLTASTLAAFACFLAGCYQSSTIGGGDAGPPTPHDAGSGFGDGAANSCDPFGGYTPCGDRCDTPCPAGFFCYRRFDICYPEAELENDCYISFGDVEHPSLSTEYCPMGGYCAPNFDTRQSGSCFSAELCRTLAPSEPGVCAYSDGTSFVNGPPELDECPAPSSDGQPGSLCGGPCGGCPSASSQGCYGVSETRPVGACIFNGGCTRTNPRRDRYCFGSFSSGSPPPDPSICSCMVLKVDGEEIELGAKVFEDSCVRYRELFPEDVECYTLDTWERL